VRDNVVGEGLDEVRLTLHDAEGVRLRGWWRTSAT
jgi:hypothetical protein